MVDLETVEAMISCQNLINVKESRRFLGLIGYQRRFIVSYGIIARPLTNMLKKNAFQWNEATGNAFHQLDEAMTKALVLALPVIPFIVDCDASSTTIGALLM